MSWNDHHTRSEHLALEAADARRAGDSARAEDLYRRAAAEEDAALGDLPREKNRTRAITAVSAVALWYKGRDYASAEAAAYRSLAPVDLPAFAEAQLRQLLQMIWTTSAAEKAGVRFVPGDVLVAVKGGEVIYGGAPLDLIIRKVETIQAILFRTVEMLLQRTFRKRGGPEGEIQAMFRPWLLQAPAGSYQFAVRMQEPRQMGFWESERPKVERITHTFFTVLRASTTSPEVDLPVLVKDRDYCAAFLSLSRNLAPTGKTFERVEVMDASSPSEPGVSLGIEARQELNAALRKLKPPRAPIESEPSVALHGTLRALHLDEDWLEVVNADPAGPPHIRIDDAGDALDDVVGPMVNKRVIVSAARRGLKYLYKDIELDE